MTKLDEDIYYLACPYSDIDERVRLFRFKTVNKIAGDLIAKGYIIFSPLSHSHPIASASHLELGWEQWQEMDKVFIRLCSKMIVLMLDDWKKSIGVQAEIEYARELGMKIIYITEFYNGDNL